MSGRNIIESNLEKYHQTRFAKEVSAIANSIFIEYLDDDIYEFEQFANQLSQKLGISPETITKALNQLVKEKRLIVANSEKLGKTFIRKVTF